MKDSEHIKPIDSVIGGVMTYFDGLYKKEIKPPFVTGLDAYDKLVKGFEGGEIHAIVSSQSEAATALALRFVHATAVTGKQPILYLSNKWTSQQLVASMLLTKSDITEEELQTNAVKPNRYHKLTEYAEILSCAPLLIEYRPTWALAMINETITACMERHDIKLVIIDDYPPDPKAMNLSDDIYGNHARIAKAANVPFLILEEAPALAPYLNDPATADQKWPNSDFLSCADSFSILRIPKVWDPKKKIIFGNLEVYSTNRGQKGMVDLTFTPSDLRFSPTLGLG